MARQRSGVILSLIATLGGIGYPRVGGFGPACCAIEAFSRNLAAELGPSGVARTNPPGVVRYLDSITSMGIE